MATVAELPVVLEASAVDISNASATEATPVAATENGDERINSILERTCMQPNRSTSCTVDPVDEFIGIPALSSEEQEEVRAGLESELPLSASWSEYRGANSAIPVLIALLCTTALFFSDTATTKKNSHGATEEQYTQCQTPLFTVDSVPALCGSLKAYKRLISSRRANQGQDTMGLASFRPGENLHFFRNGIAPTWEDPMNEKVRFPHRTDMRLLISLLYSQGGRLTISPPLAVFDRVYESIVLLLAGASLESSAAERLNPSGTPASKPEGIVTGVVASRRARGDRIELWLGGKDERTPAPTEWVDKIKEVLSIELEMPDVRCCTQLLRWFTVDDLPVNRSGRASIRSISRARISFSLAFVLLKS